MFNCESCGWYSGKICFYADKLTTPSSSCEAWKEQETPSETRWIPVSERLPESSERVLVSIDLKGESISITNNFDVEFGKWRLWHNFVTAWMPLPEPYKPN